MTANPRECVYDNPGTYCREYWVSGHLYMHVSAAELLRAPAKFGQDLRRMGSRRAHSFAWLFELPPWRSGRVIGTLYAIMPHANESRP